jgi:hypothetical protein
MCFKIKKNNVAHKSYATYSYEMEPTSSLAPLKWLSQELVKACMFQPHSLKGCLYEFSMEHSKIKFSKEMSYFRIYNGKHFYNSLKKKKPFS